jgi:hypothetical protein
MCYPVASAVIKTSTVTPTVEHAALGVVIRAASIIINTGQIDINKQTAVRLHLSLARPARPQFLWRSAAA